MWGGILVILAVGIGLDTLSRRGTRNWVASR